MELSKESKEKIVSRHIEMFDGLLRGDIDTFSNWWTDNIIIYGTAISETFTDKQSAIDFYKSTTDQVAGLVRMENRHIDVYEHYGYVILTEKLDFHVKVEDQWMFYHHSRLTAVWTEIEGEWYVTHVHCSYPDAYSGEGEQINPEQLRSENIKLKRAVEERTAELEQKNRELEIEIALDKIRSRSLAMHHSNEILEVAYLVSEKLKELSLGIDAVAIILISDDHYEYWIANDEGAYTTKIIDDTINGNPSVVLKDVSEYHKKGIDFTNCYTGEDKRVHWEYVFANTGFHIVPDERKRFILDQVYYNICVTFQDHISLTVIRYNNNEYSSSEQAIVKKFCNVFAQAYTRFQDLETAERQTKEARIEFALEKVRSRSLIMRHSDELSEVVKTVFDNLRDLHFDLTDSAVVINLFQEDTDDIVQWITDNEQTYPRSFRHPHFDNPILNDIKAARKNGLDYFSATYSFEDKNAFWRYYFEHTDFSRFPNHIQQDILNRKSYAQSMALQKHTGILYPNIDGRMLDQEEEHILKRFSVVFEQAYIRFLDLQKAEEQALRAKQDLIAIQEARKKAEETLQELLSTQKQLIQSEKMASLGELTAGIAHEIQNPLNFVNNFSEVSNELIDEMNAELDKGDITEAKTIAADIKQNLEKIAHHGKRADAIVKGMLQHSRSGTGQKESTNINALCDEYLRLAYHGIRAKDSGFNAILETDFDNSIGSVLIQPQEMGRVILNLINNALYAVGEKKNKGIEGFEPKVKITTKQKNGSIEICVEDNGMGIPAQVKEKIFQPFFTTKPTGQGTGLGLSLSYDIVKAHKGALKVESQEGLGTSFTITLPMN